LENAKLPDFHTLYLKIFRGKNLIGLMYFQVLHFHENQLDPQLLKGTGITLLKNLILLQDSGVLICGNMFHLNEPGYFFPNPGDQHLVFPLTRSLTRRKTGRHIIATLIKDIPMISGETDVAGFQSFDTDICMSMDLLLSWSNWDDYLNSLSKKYRQRALKIRKAGFDLERRKLTEAELLLHSNAIGQLYQDVRQRQAVRIGSLNAGYFIEMLRANPETFEVWGYFEGDVMQAFSSYFIRPDNSLEIHYIGFNSTANETFFLYFNILFDGLVQCIERKKSKLLLGRTGYDAKASLGAKSEPSAHYYRIRRGWPALAFQYLIKAWESRENQDWQSRNPFKSSVPEPIEVA
jgi:hypothetical protein